MGGKRCGALRQWGRQANILDSPRKVAKCRLRFSWSEPSALHRCLITCRTQVSRPSDFPGGESRRGTPKLGIASLTGARTIVSYPHCLGFPVLSGRLPPGGTITTGPLYGGHIGGAQRQSGEAVRSPEKTSAQRATLAGRSILVQAPRSRPRPSWGARLASLRDQLN